MSAGFVELLETGMEKASCLRYRMNRGKRPLFYGSHQLSYVWSNNYMHLKGKEKGTFVNDLFTLSNSRKIFCNKLPNTPPPVVLKCLSESPQNKLEQLTQADLYVYKLPPGSLFHKPGEQPLGLRKKDGNDSVVRLLWFCAGIC